MSREDRQRLEDILAAIGAIRAHLVRGNLSDGLVFECAQRSERHDDEEVVMT